MKTKKVIAELQRLIDWSIEWQEGIEDKTANLDPVAVGFNLGALVSDLEYIRDRLEGTR